MSACLVLTSNTSKDGVLVGGEKAPGSVVLKVHVELTLLIVKTKRCTMHTDDITNTVNNWEVLSGKCSKRLNNIFRLVREVEQY